MVTIFRKHREDLCALFSGILTKDSHYSYNLKHRRIKSSFPAFSSLGDEVSGSGVFSSPAVEKLDISM